MITRIVEQVLRSPIDRVYVVTGPDRERLTAALAGRRVEFVTNPSAEGEMLTSVREGLRALPGTCAAILVVLGDQPGLTAEVIARLIQAYRAARPGIVVPTYRGQRGHPLLFDSRYREEILTGYDHVGLRGLLRAHPEAVVEVAVESPGVLEDVDVPEDYRRIAGRGSGP